MLKFSEIQPKNMLQICLSTNIEKKKILGLTDAWREWFVRGYQKEKIFEVWTF